MFVVCFYNNHIIIRNMIIISNIICDNHIIIRNMFSEIFCDLFL